jgi:hypothetical protein
MCPGKCGSGTRESRFFTGEITPRNTGGYAMLQKLNLFLVAWDLPTMEIGTDVSLSWEELHTIVQASADLLWDMKGERRRLPFNLLADYCRIHEGHLALIRLGRSSEISRPLVITRDQTVSA